MIVRRRGKRAFAFADPKQVGGERRCGMCRAFGHTTLQCPKRKPARLCGDCGNLPWRVEGSHCWTCGLAHAPESPVKLDLEARRAV